MARSALNEGRSVNPGDTYSSSLVTSERSTCNDAQRRPERQPRRHPPATEVGTFPLGVCHAQRRPERQPRRHPPARTSVPCPRRWRSAQRRPERQPRRHCAASARLSHRVDNAPLNEGRSVNPGDTSAADVLRRRTVRVRTAQRRPERQPRRHDRSVTGGQRGARGARSTKAGASTPATPLGFPSLRKQQPRSTKAAASTPATPDVQAGLAKSRTPLDDGRSVNPGDTLTFMPTGEVTYSAQRRPERQPRRHRHALLQRHCSATLGAQRRPERQPRRHVWVLGKLTDHSTDAQRRPERQPRRHSSSRARTDAAPRSTLNEGRSVNPGDTSSSRSTSDGIALSCRSTKAGASTPATRRVSAVDRSRVDHGTRSTKAGASTPATHLNSLRAVMSRLPSSAQRRPERQPRRHRQSSRYTCRCPAPEIAQRRPERQPRRHG